MPLYRRLPKRGFNNIFRKEYIAINVETLDSFEAGTQIDPIILRDHGIIKNLRGEIKILGNGELTKSVNVRAHKFSKSAIEKIQKAGGTIEVIV